MKKKFLLVALLLMFAFVGCGEEKPKEPSTTSQEVVEVKKEEVKKEIVTVELSAGTYVSGLDFPAGKYNIIAVKGGGNVASSNQFSGGINAIMGKKTKNDPFAEMYEEEYSNVNLSSNEVLNIMGNLVIKIISTKEIDPSFVGRVEVGKAITLKSGHYTVGEDIEAGIYNVVAKKGNGNVISQSSENPFGINEIMGVNKNEMYLKKYNNLYLNKGDTLSVDGVVIELIPLN